MRLLSNGIALTAAALLAACGGDPHHSALPPPPPAAGVMYDVIPILEAPTGDIRVTSRGINESNMVTGTIYATPDSPSRAFLFNGATTIDLGDFGGRYAQAFAINRCGHVAGWALGPGGGDVLQAFLYDGTLRNIGTPGIYSEATAINDCDQVTGVASGHAYLYDGVMHDLGTLGGPTSRGVDINDSGVVMGTSQIPGPIQSAPVHTFLYDKRTGAGLQDIGTLGGTFTGGRDLNNVGQIAGTARLASNDFRAFRYSGGVVQNLGTLEGDEQSEAVAINDSGYVVGTSSIPTRTRGFMFDGVRMHAIGFPGAGASEATAINASGVVVGSAPPPGDTTHAISRTLAGGIVDLNTRVHAAPPGLVLFRALAINDEGSIVVLTYTGLVLLKVRH
jgi:probable HAF family extracellular repeat protein